MEMQPRACLSSETTLPVLVPTVPGSKPSTRRCRHPSWSLPQRTGARALSVRGSRESSTGGGLGGAARGGLTVGQRLRAAPALRPGPRAAQAQEGPEASPRTAQDGWGCSHATASEHGFQEGRGAWSVHTGSFLMEQRRVSSSAQGNSSLSTMPRALRDKCCTVPRP